MPRASLLKMLAQAKSLFGGGQTRSRTGTEPVARGPIAGDDRLEVKPEAGKASDPAKPDATFWATMAEADKRLADLRRAIDEAAAEAAARDTGGRAPPSWDPRSSPSRCEMAARVIYNALDAEKS